jgi:hypothetical protein
MREFDAFERYPSSGVPRRVTATRGSIHNRIIASYRGVAFYDGERDSGMGGMKYDGRWEPTARYMAQVYGLGAHSKVLQVGTDKGFLLEEFRKLGIQVRGTDVSNYAIKSAPEGVRPFIEQAAPVSLPYKDSEFDFVIAAGPVYSLTLEDAIKCLREIGRVGKGRSFITLGAYDTEDGYWLFRSWTLLGCTILSRSDWLEVMEHAGYTGDYRFNTAESLGLVWA